MRTPSPYHSSTFNTVKGRGDSTIRASITANIVVPSSLYTVVSKKLEHGCRMIYAGFTSFFGFGLAGDYCSYTRRYFKYTSPQHDGGNYLGRSLSLSLPPSLSLSLSLSACIYIYICTYVYIYIYTHIYLCVCMCPYTEREA